MSFLIACGSPPEVPIDEESLINQSWVVKDVTGSTLDDLIGLCFIMFSEDNSLYIHDKEGYILDGPYYWEQVGENIFEIDGLGSAYVYPIEETKKEDWEIEVRSGTFISATITTERCKRA